MNPRKSKGRKQPVAAESPNRQKLPRAAESTGPVKRPGVAAVPGGENVLARTPVWRFAAVDHEQDWNLHSSPGSFRALGGDDLVDFMRKLGEYERMTIRELFHDGGYPGKFYDVPEMPKAALRRLTELSRDDETRLAVLRVTGERRLYGFLREHCFDVLWWDPHHQVYPSQKKHT